MAFNSTKYEAPEKSRGIMHYGQGIDCPFEHFVSLDICSELDAHESSTVSRQTTLCKVMLLCCRSASSHASVFIEWQWLLVNASSRLPKSHHANALWPSRGF
ncbi:hypothetical protein H0G86_000918 [Trichoderma simmonsii]|uniref:Uncharacterized protein n=1 Tax=Trichoderma simmonsii TaxID=1491479 RepID=A0A8G0L5A3_9HYPO|nr:hypothetical protein H0G86_000918 [Trichoderma simmonsii]